MTDATMTKGQICEGCPRFDNKRCGSGGKSSHVDVLFIAEQPDEPSAMKQMPFRGHGGRVVRSAIDFLQAQHDKYKAISIGFTYAVQCVSNDDSAPNKDVLHHCHPNMQSTIKQLNPKIIVAMGSTALRQLGVKQKFNDSRNKFVKHYAYEAPIFVTFSEKALLAAPGIFETFKLNVVNVFDRVINAHVTQLSLDELSKNYRVPKTIEEAIAVCDEIINYSNGKVKPEDWHISVDTETNTLHPEKDTSKIIAFCFGYDDGKATTILYEHPQAGEEYLRRLPELTEKIKELLACRKPKILHNAKFDLKFIELRYGFPVKEVWWDTLLGEHLLDEDKKGNYGLKVLTANLLPQYCGYEDKLYDLLEDNEIVSKADETAKELEDLRKILATEHPEYIKKLEEYRDALIQYEKEKVNYDAALAKYQNAIEDYYFCKDYLAGRQAAWAVEVADWPKGKRGKPKKPVKWFAKPEKPETLREPKRPEDPRSKKEQEISQDSGFENIPAHDLQIYGAVDGDVTRQLANKQYRRILTEKSKVRPLMASHAIPASRVLGRMEYGGTRVDQAYIDVLEDALSVVVRDTEQELYQMAGRTQPNGKPLNLNGAATLASVLYNWGWVHPDGTRMSEYAILARTKKNQASTSEKVLRQFVAYEDDKKTIPTKSSYFIERLLRYRKASKALNTFLANIRALSKRDGFLHTQFHLNGTGTGRLSCVAADTLLETSAGTFKIADPALQNISDLRIKTHRNRWRRIRKVFPKGNERMYRVTLESGQSIDCTMKHKFLTPAGWLRLGDLRIGDIVETAPCNRGAVCGRLYNEGVAHGRSTGAAEHKPYDILPTAGISCEIQGRIARQLEDSLCEVQAGQSVWCQGTAESITAKRRASHGISEGLTITRNSPAISMQSVLSQTQYRASSADSCGRGWTASDHASQLQSSFARTIGNISTWLGSSCEEIGHRTRTILQPITQSEFAINTGVLADSAIGEAQFLLYRQEPRMELGSQPLRSVLSACLGGRANTVSPTVPFAEKVWGFLGRFFGSRQDFRRNRRTLSFEGSCYENARQSKNSVSEEDPNTVTPFQRNGSMAQHCTCDDSYQGSACAFGYSNIQTIEYLGIQQVWDLSVEEDESYVAHGFINHNSSDMNMQNVPKFLAGWNIKKLFVPDDDSHVLVNLDYKGAEVRVFTAYARDEALIHALNEGLDMHSFFASKVFKRPYEMYANRDNPDYIPDSKLRKLLDSERSQIKRVVFGILYGAGANKISETIGVDVEEAEALIALLYEMFPEIALYAHRVEKEVEMNKFVETHFGRRRRFPLAGIQRHAGRAKRQARNFKIQSTSSDIVLGQLVEMEEPLRCDFGGRMLLTVHDSLVFQFPKKYITQLNDFAIEYAENKVRAKYPWMPVPFKADIEIGDNYGECQSIDKYLAKHPLLLQQEGIVEENELLTELRTDAFEAA